MDRHTSRLVLLLTTLLLLGACAEPTAPTPPTHRGCTVVNGSSTCLTR